MSYADQVFIQNCQDILSRGVWDTDREVRPRWEDGTPAHTIKLFGVVNRYDLRREFPILTVRRQFLKSAVDELLWIWQKKSNNVHDLNSRIWDACYAQMKGNRSLFARRRGSGRSGTGKKDTGRESAGGAGKRNQYRISGGQSVPEPDCG